MNALRSSLGDVVKVLLLVGLCSLIQGCMVPVLAAGAAVGYGTYKVSESGGKDKASSEGGAASDASREDPGRPREGGEEGSVVVAGAATGSTVVSQQAAQAGSESQREVLTNESVISMIKAGFAEEVIILKIRATPANFDLRTEALLAIKNAGVSDRVLEAMLTKAGGPPAGPAPQLRETVFHLKDGKEVEIDYLDGRRTTGGFLPPTLIGVFSGGRARLRVSEERPTFLLGWNPSGSWLVRLETGSNNSERRVGIGRGAFAIFVSAREGPSDDDIVQINAEKLPSGYYRVTPKTPLPRGEYGFLRLPGGALGGQPRLWDFGRD